jgi:hypothetical protein
MSRIALDVGHAHLYNVGDDAGSGRHPIRARGSRRRIALTRLDAARTPEPPARGRQLIGWAAGPYDHEPMLQPGEQTTRIILWEVDDPSKLGDPRFWWPTEQPFTLSDGRELRGPKGISLAKLRARSGSDEIELDVLPPSIRADRPADATSEGVRKVKISTADWGGSDPQRTYVIVSHRYRPTAEEAADEKARRGEASPFPSDAEALRQKWLAALEAGDQERAAELNARFEERLGKQGWLKPYAHPNQGVEIQPSVYLLDMRPQPVA